MFLIDFCVRYEAETRIFHDCLKHRCVKTHHKYKTYKKKILELYKYKISKKSLYFLSVLQFGLYKTDLLFQQSNFFYESNHGRSLKKREAKKR